MDEVGRVRRGNEDDGGGGGDCTMKMHVGRGWMCWVLCCILCVR